MTRTLLSIGECMIELAPRSEDCLTMGFAGDTFNTAWYARRSLRPGDDIDIAYLSAVGDDTPSMRMTDFIRDAGIRPILRVRQGRSVGLYLISLNNGERSFSYWRDSSAARSLADDLEELPVKGQGDLVFISGITLAILPQAGRKRLYAALENARRNGVTVAFDPNLRPRLWSDTDEMRREIMRAASLADILLPSHEDEATHFGDRDPHATARRYLAACSAPGAMVVVKDGPGPVRIYAGGTHWDVPTVKSPHVEDTTAAGDSFNGRFLVGLMRGEPVAEAARAACQLAAQVIGKRGALVAVDGVS
ncbi:2-dehydro-3-deoxygluconokinase [Albidovulum inexpectatum]|uniref:2-dehydro-3-deoxygluconokinase n=1 Tax=Albidovulum inexpectatum TaxID=196587 RepID=A0A2S5JHE1_9RHOB|nr:sugar kinase [Albidovulum inexpectatum]PPB80829.1 2-dehydro-3-deoxygluconokinase [Albidovulum inexpectatum]